MLHAAERRSNEFGQYCYALQHAEQRFTPPQHDPQGPRSVWHCATQRVLDALQEQHRRNVNNIEEAVDVQDGVINAMKGVTPGTRDSTGHTQTEARRARSANARPILHRFAAQLDRVDAQSALDEYAQEVQAEVLTHVSYLKWHHAKDWLERAARACICQPGVS